MTITITLRTTRAAFDGDRDREVRRILRAWLVTEFQPGTVPLPLDYDGYPVGTVTIQGP